MNPLSTRRIALARQERQPCSVTQCSLVAEVFAAQHEGVHTLRRQGLDAVLHARRMAVVDAASYDPGGRPEALADLVQQAARGGADPAASDPTRNHPPSQSLQLKLPARTLDLPDCFLFVCPKQLISHSLCH